MKVYDNLQWNAADLYLLDAHALDEHAHLANAVGQFRKAELRGFTRYSSKLDLYFYSVGNLRYARKMMIIMFRHEEKCVHHPHRGFETRMKC